MEKVIQPAYRARYKKCLLLVAAAVMLLLSSGKVVAQNLQVEEYKVKAAFVYNFTRFVEWAPEAFPNASSPFVIGIIGDDPFGATIDEITAGENVQGHPIVVERYPNISKLTSCHILFISNQGIRNLQDLRSFLPPKNTLTVSDAPDFARQGGMIRLLIEGNKTRLQINLSAAKSADIKISSKLLDLSEVINEGR